VRPEALDSDDARALIAQLDDHLRALYPPEDNFFSLEASEVDGTRGVFLVARVRGVAVGCGAVRLRSPFTGEIKRMFVASTHRGRGVGHVVLDELEAWARRAGAQHLVLETGPHQDEAIALYERCGFTPIPCFGEYVHSGSSICYGKDLTDAGTADP